MNEIEYYENEAFWTESRFLHDEQELNRFKVIQSLIPHSTKTLLDVGCGNGAFLKFLEANNSIIQKTGYERSQVAVKNKLCESEIISGSAEKIIYSDNSFDLLLALEVIEHLPFLIYERTLQELQRIAAKYIIISVPHKEIDRLIKCKYCGCSYSPFFHLREFDKKKMENLFESFSLIQSSLIGKHRKYFLWDLLKKIWYIKIKNTDVYPPIHSTCPHCGFNLKDGENEGFQVPAQTKINRIKYYLKSLTPYRISYTWIACLYQKK